MSITEKLLTIEEVATRLSVSKDSVRRLIARGNLKRIKVMGLVRIPESEVHRLCDEADSVAPNRK